MSICPPTGTGVKHSADDLFHTPLEQPQIDFENEGGETYICGNPPYKGGTEQDKEQKSDMSFVFSDKTKTWKSLDYISAWFYKASEYGTTTQAKCAFVSTNSVCQGEQVARLWPMIFALKQDIFFAHTPFKWANLASHNAGVTVAIIGLSNLPTTERELYSLDTDGKSIKRTVPQINAYLVPYKDVQVSAKTNPVSHNVAMTIGSKPVDGGNLIVSSDERKTLINRNPAAEKFIHRYVGANELIHGLQRFCVWVKDDLVDEAREIADLRERFTKVKEMRLASKKKLTQKDADRPHAFQQVRQTGNEVLIAIPAVTSENREFLTCDLLQSRTIISNRNFGIHDGPLWSMAIISSRLHWVWIETVCGKLEMRFNYSNTLGWNTFPTPILTEKNIADLTRCAEDILLAREAYFPATLADLYEVKNSESKMPSDLREAHERNDEVLERIYIGRRFKNDTERLEKLFELYTKMTTPPDATKTTSKMKA